MCQLRQGEHLTQMAEKFRNIVRAAAAGCPLSGALCAVRENGRSGSPDNISEFLRHLGQTPPLPQLARGS